MAAASSFAAKWAARQLHRDVMIHTFTPLVRIAMVQCTHSVNDALKRFNVKDVGSATLFSRMLTSSLLLSAFLKGEERVIIQAM